jgi:ubiquinone/menaquinone biosynthesis C-methylase UbiE
MIDKDELFKTIFRYEVEIIGNLIILDDKSKFENQQQTKEAFSEKWITWYQKVDDKEKERLYDLQKKWYLKLYGFENEEQLSEFLRSKNVIFDAGCGLGYKAKWFADLAPDSLVIGMELSDSVFIAAKEYNDTKNLLFIKGDIADTLFRDDVVDYVSCDQVLMHTENPEATFKELVRILKKGGQIAFNVYAKKALPRELLDTYFRTVVKDIRYEDLWEMSKQLTELGRILSDLKIEIEVPDIPLLRIKGGKYDLQRFIYWNFIKCFWNEELGYDTSVVVNFDWYAPSNAKTYSEDEFLKMIYDNDLEIMHLHKEEACYAGRFKKR